MQTRYVIGDVHGEYQTLLSLLEKLPKEAKLVFVGDLTDRGSQSKEVVEFVRKNNHLCVMGNHEALMVWYAKHLIQYLNREILYGNMPLNWDTSGRLHTFCSYGLLELSDGAVSKFINDKKGIAQLLEDIRWMQKLPFYLELDAIHSSGKKVVVSHSNISKVWELRHDDEQKNHFYETTLWGRDSETSNEVNIFNIYGHTPRPYKTDVREDYACIDRGCCYHTEEEYGVLSAYCVESAEVFEVSRVGN
jgi:serine/threonine protein phosphatase 1